MWFRPDIREPAGNPGLDRVRQPSLHIHLHLEYDTRGALFAPDSVRTAAFAGGKKMELSFYGLTIALFIFLIWFWNSLYVIKEWERGVVLRLGRMQPDAKGAGLRVVFWPIETLYRISLRIETLDVPSQDIITRDNVSVKVNAVAYFRVVDANLALSQVQNYLYATSQKAQTTLRSIVGQFELDEILAEREKVNSKLQVILDQDTEPWGIKVTKVEVKQVDIPEQMQRAIGRQAEAERERRAKVIHAEGEAQASTKLAEAAQVLETQPAAIQLRYLQTLTEIGVEKNTTIVFPLPIDIINEWVKAIGTRK
jgi:regulator of protease activity HflC (stomatin/prohibitin superfamily)